MKKNTKNVAPVVAAKPVRDWKTAPHRTQIYIVNLMRKHGATAQELKDAVLEQLTTERRGQAFTSHNSYSLQKLATTYGFRFWSDAETYALDAKRYYFGSAQNDSKIAAQEAKAREKVKAERDAVRAAYQAAKQVKAPARVAKAARKPAIRLIADGAPIATDDNSPTVGAMASKANSAAKAQA